MRTVGFRLLYCFLAVATLFAGCSKKDSARMEQKLEKIWKMSDYDLDGAISSARLINDSISFYGETIKQKYDLLNIRLRDKQELIPSSVDSIKAVTEYFEKHGTPKDLMRAYHYISSAYRDLHDRPNAILYDLKALEVSEKENVADSAMLEKIYSQLSTLYRQQLNMKRSIEMAIKHYEVSADKVWATMDIANAYFFEGDSVNSLHYYNKAYPCLVNDTMFNYHPALHAEMLARYALFGEETKSDSLYQLLCSIPAAYRPANYYSAVGEYFMFKNMIDSASTYFRAEFTTSESVGTKCDAASSLMECYNIKGYVDSVAKYAVLFAHYNDSVILERKFEQTRNADAEYRYQRNAEEEALILQRDIALRKRIYAITVISLLIIMGGCIFYFYRRKKMLEMMLSKDREIERKRVQNDNLLQLALMRKTEDNATDVIEKFKNASIGQHPLTDNDWTELMTAIDSMYPTFKGLLQDKIPKLTKPVIQTAYLMKAGVNNPQIASLMDIPRQTVWYRSNAIRKALGEDLQMGIDSNPE